MARAAAPRLDAERWRTWCDASPVLARYREADRERLREVTARFLSVKSVEPAGGLELTEEMRMVIGSLACVPVLNLGLDWYAGWYAVVVYPGDFVARHEYVDEAGVVHSQERELSGEAWDRGPVVLSWAEVESGAHDADHGNVVIHELAHKLDLSNGTANGLPPLHAEMSRRAWTATWTRAFDRCRAWVETGEASELEEAATEDPGEFFAVMSELFFVQPGALKSSYPGVYGQLRRFYRQDPAGEERAASARSRRG